LYPKILKYLWCLKSLTFQKFLSFLTYPMNQKYLKYLMIPKSLTNLKYL
jgi:hypothetical protein